MSAQDWKDELRQAKNAHSFKELNSDWSAFGLKSEKIQPPKQKPFKCDDCTASFNLKSNLQLHRRHQHKYEAYFQFSKKKLADHIRKRRGQGKPVSTTYIRRKMKQFCIKDKVKNFDEEKNIFGQHWVTNYMDKNNFSVRRTTNIKKKSIFERLHKVHNYHWYTQFQMALEDISDLSESEEEEEEEEFLDARSNESEEETEDESTEDCSESEEETEDESYESS
jgi:hypothetical protein